MTRNEDPGQSAVDHAMAVHLRAMQQDPVGHRTLAAWQRLASDAIEEAIDGLTQQLMLCAAPQPDGGKPFDVLQARTRAARRQAQLRQCRELAREMVLASVCHLDDADWDPFAPDAAPRPGANVLTQLLGLA